MKRKIDNCRVRRSDREIKSNGERAKNRETGTEKVTKGGERENTTVKGEKGCERGGGAEVDGGGGGSRRSNIQRNVPGG